MLVKAYGGLRSAQTGMAETTGRKSHAGWMEQTTETRAGAYDL